MAVITAGPSVEPSLSGVRPVDRRLALAPAAKPTNVRSTAPNIGRAEERGTGDRGALGYLQRSGRYRQHRT
jgi:hypothetical protein